MKGRAKANAVRSGVVVLGSMAFGYLTLQVGLRPYLEKAQLAVEETQPPPPPPSSSAAEQPQDEQPNSSSTRHF